MTKQDLSQEYKVFQQWKSIHVTQCINKMKEKFIIISVDTEKAFEKSNTHSLKKHSGNQE